MSNPSDETERVAHLAGWYQTEQLDFDRRIIAYKYRSFREWLRGPEGLELGPADGTMTKTLVNDFRKLSIVDGSAELLRAIPAAANLVKVHALFEEFQAAGKFNTILMAHILEHIEDPVALIQRAARG